MKIDLHTHTVISGHAYSTLQENVLAARNAGLSALAVTDHGPAMPGVLGDAYSVVNMRLSVPEYLEGIRIIRGFEANIIDYDGKTDLPKTFAPSVEFILGSLHEICIVPRGKKENTEALLNAMATGLVDAIGHPDSAGFPLDYGLLAEGAKAYKVALEVNNNSLKGRVRGDCGAAIEEMLHHAKRVGGVYVSVGSDSHFFTTIGEMDLASRLLKEVAYPTELIISNSLERFQEFLEIRSQERTIL